MPDTSLQDECVVMNGWREYLEGHKEGAGQKDHASEVSGDKVERTL